MKQQMILISFALLFFGCQKSNSTTAPKPVASGSSPSAPVAPAPVKAEWQKKLEACPLKLQKDMSLEQLAETSRQMHQDCGFSEEEWDQVVKSSL